jgi:hypothetical protein
MRKSSAIVASAIALAMFVPLKASAQGVSIYVGPGYPGYGDYPVYGGYPAYDPGYMPYDAGYPGYVYPPYPRYYGGYSYPGYGYGRPYYGTYWGHGRRVARRVYRRHDPWD